MKPADVQKPVEEGIAIANATQMAGEFALHERDVRRIGLAVSVLLIGSAILAIRLLLRRMEGTT
jgi:hypothetical protein